jgi:multiple sugar transport system permease protein
MKTATLVAESSSSNGEAMNPVQKQKKAHKFCFWKTKEPTTSNSIPPRHINHAARKEAVAGWLFATPLILGLLLFTLIPMVCSLIWSFKDYDGFLVNEWVGFGNYIKIFTADKEMPLVVRNTAIYTFVSIPLNLILSYLLAVFVNNDHKFTKVFRVLFYLPCVIPAVVNGLLWKDITNNTFGIFNQILTSIGLPKFTFFSSASTSMFSLILMNVWGIGGGMILWLSAFKNIPSTLYEAAKIDGANAFQRFAHITIPMSTPIIFFNLVTSVIGSLQYNGTLVIASRDGRGEENSLYLFGVKIWYTAFKDGQLGYACALSWVLCLVISIFTIILFKSSKWVFYGEDA